MVELREDLYIRRARSHYLICRDFVHNRGMSIRIFAIREINPIRSACSFKNSAYAKQFYRSESSSVYFASFKML